QIWAKGDHGRGNHQALRRQGKRVQGGTRSVHLPARRQGHDARRRHPGRHVPASVRRDLRRQGKKIKNVVFAPQPTLQRIQMTEEDFDDIENRLPFVLTSDEIGEYDIMYVGQQKQDELNTYVFDINPKQIEKKKRYFQGRIWVDDHDFQIVETYGKTVPDLHPGKKGNENLFPKFTTWREQIDGQYWFPTYTRAEDTLQFAMGGVRIREIIKYTNYRRFGSKSRITYEGQEVQKAEPKPEDQKPAEPPKPQ